MARETVAMILSGSLLTTLQAAEVTNARAGEAVDERADFPACPVTVVNDGKGGIYANDSLQVVLWPDNKFVFKPDGPGFIDEDGALGMKVGWWRHRQGLLQIRGRRLDGDAEPARAYIYDYGNVGFQPIYLVFPTAGCWEITGSVGDSSLTFVTLVERIGEGPASRLRGPHRGWRVSQ
jgi:hypothetical protein